MGFWAAARLNVMLLGILIEQYMWFMFVLWDLAKLGTSPFVSHIHQYVQIGRNLWVWCSLSSCLLYLSVTQALSSRFLKVLKDCNSLVLEDLLESFTILHNLGTYQGLLYRFKVMSVFIFSRSNTEWLYTWNVVKSELWKICMDKKRNLTIGCFLRMFDWASWGGHTGRRRLCWRWVRLLLMRWEPMSELLC